MKIMRWRKKKSSDKYTKNTICHRFTIVVGLFLILTVVAALVNSQIVSADADSDLKTEVYNYKTAMKIKSCSTTLSESQVMNRIVSLSEAGLNSPAVNGNRIAVNSSSTFDEGIIDAGFPKGDTRNQVMCDVIYLANQNNHGDYFANSLKSKHIDDDCNKSTVVFQSQWTDSKLV